MDDWITTIITDIFINLRSRVRQSLLYIPTISNIGKGLTETCTYHRIGWGSWPGYRVSFSKLHDE
jgi:hypothetical protein